MSEQDSSDAPAKNQWLPLIAPDHVRERTRKILIDRPDLRSDVDKRLFEGAAAVLECYLGKTWVKTHVATNTPSDFLVPKSDIPGLRKIAKGYSRILMLAESLLTMQRTPGIVDRVSDLKTKDVEGCFGELQGAMLLVSARVPFEFRRETQNRRDRRTGSDFDVVATVDARKVNCEMKAKCEGTVPKASALRAQLKTARSQLPEGEPNIVFLRLPESWMTSRTAEEEVRQGINGHFRDSTRVTSVVIHWEEWTEFSETDSLLVLHYRQYPNPRAPQVFPDLSSKIDSWISGKRDNWFSLHQFVLSREELAQRIRSTSLFQLAKQSAGLGFFFESRSDAYETKKE